MITIIRGLAPGQVLQRLKKGWASVRVQGRCDEDGPVRARLILEKEPNGKARSWIAGEALKGTFSATLDRLPVGGPFRIAFEIGKESLVVEDIFVGDVWILAGQSNMEGCGSLQARTPSDPLVRAMYMDGHWARAEDPLHCVEDSPDAAHAPIRWQARVRARLKKIRTKGVGPGISFGSEMVRRSGGVPQGLICCAHGGSRMEQWDPRSKALGGGSMYGSLLRSCRDTSQPVAGILWYQGESETNEEDGSLYFQNMVRLIRAFRKDLQQPTLGIVLVQLGREYGVESMDAPWNRIQLEQAKLTKELDRVTCVTAVDLPMEDNIHLSSSGQFRLGRRLAMAADRLVYGNRKELAAPEVKSVIQIRRPAPFYRGKLGLTVRFKNVVGGLQAKGPLEGFGLMDSSGKTTRPFYRAEIVGNTVRLEAAENIRGGENQRLVYGYGRKPFCTLTDSRDMAVGVFGPIPLEATMPISKPFTRWLMSESQPHISSVAAMENAPRRTDYSLSPCHRALFVTPTETPPVFSGVIFFFTELEALETMRCHFRLGYDGPIRLWLNDREVWSDPHGTNPIIIDEVVRPVRLNRGRHRLVAAIDFRSGLSWGFLLRFSRADLTRSKLKSGVYSLPECCL